MATQVLKEVSELIGESYEYEVGILPTAGVKEINPWRSDDRWCRRYFVWKEWLKADGTRRGIIPGGYRMIPGEHVPLEDRVAYSQVTLASRCLADIYYDDKALLQQISVVDGRGNHSVDDLMLALPESIPHGKESVTRLVYFSHGKHYQRVARTPTCKFGFPPMEHVESSEDDTIYRGPIQLGLVMMQGWDPKWEGLPAQYLREQADRIAKREAKKWLAWAEDNQEEDLREFHRHQAACEAFKSLLGINKIFSPPPIEE